ncbi:hypothetical protein [Micromonospora craniellae]|uniref:Uncharacterized protein n=1 Tax=Micromonospora craniellae TaxID=2294034 RepID=A0A372FRY2_9ACTN|nr:hypothetical protein ID554_27225 [Micromonospora craniellae]RFS43525.1 hypothetical protein D0Q02_27225 [Micromonospora craniellae]
MTSSIGGVVTGAVSDWLEDGTPPLTANPGYRSDFVDGYKHPQQLFARAEEIARQFPQIAEIVYLPHRTNGYQRKAQATIGGTGQSAVVVNSAAWGHEGGNDVTVEFVHRGGGEPAARGRGDRHGGARGAGHERQRRAGQHRRRGGAGVANPVAGADRPGASVPQQRRHRRRGADHRPGGADRLPGPEAGRRTGG